MTAPTPGPVGRFLREPLVHFIAAGALIFAVYAVVRPPQTSATDARRIRLTQGDLAQLRQGWIAQWRRPPTPEELQGLVDNRIREEILSREALELGLDRDDVIVRRRLALKYEFLTQDLAEMRIPTDADLASFFTEHPEKYRIAGGLTFVQVFFSAGDRAQQALERLRAGADPDTVGDPTLLEAVVRDRREDEVGRQFGQSFLEGISKAETGKWAGPVRSAYGWHAVKLEHRQTPRMPELGEVKEAVARDWRDQQRRSVNDGLYGKLKQRYAITIEAPPASKPVLGLTEEPK